MAAWVGWLAWKWGLAQSFRARLLAMLHVALVMLCAGTRVLGRREPRRARRSPGSVRTRPASPARRWATSSATTLAMVSRVSLGHSGRALEADPMTWYGFLALIGCGGQSARSRILPRWRGRRGRRCWGSRRPRGSRSRSAGPPGSCPPISGRAPTAAPDERVGGVDERQRARAPSEENRAMADRVSTDLPMLRIRGREALPVVQGGMGVGVSAHRLAGSVAREGAVGTLSSVDLAPAPSRPHGSHRKVARQVRHRRGEPRGARPGDQGRASSCPRATASSPST